jgi:hypothetical protein
MANGENHMRGINVGSRKAIIVNGVFKGTFLTYKDRTTFVHYKDDGSKFIRVFGPVDSSEEIAKLDPSTVKDSYYIVQCVFVALTNQVKITLKHSVLPMWDCEFVVDRTPTWANDFYVTFNALQRSRDQETHIANRQDMIV